MINGMGRHASEFARAVRNNKFEVMDDGGLLFPEQRAVAAGVYILGLNGVEIERTPNLIPNEGLNFILDLIGNHATFVQPYIALYANALTPIATHTASGFTATYSEITSGSEGYTETTRQSWLSATSAAQATNNYASPAVFTIITASTLTVNGVAMLTASAKGATTGKLLSASRFAAARTFSNTDEFSVKYQLGLTAS